MGFVYDWYSLDYDAISHLLLLHIGEDKACRILEIGAGNSTLPPGLLEEGYRDITAVDYSQVVIEQMRKRNPKVRSR